MTSALGRELFDFVVTSPPYWNILEKNGDYKSLAMRRSRSLPTNYGRSRDNLSNITNYRAFLMALRRVFLKTQRTLKGRKYMCVIVSDFKHGSKFYPFHMDLASIILTCGFTLEGITVLASNRKHLYPYGMPSAYVPNIHHGYILIFRKTSPLVS
jgi:DNA modification methylase